MIDKPAENIYQKTPDHYDDMMTIDYEMDIFNAVANEIRNHHKGHTKMLDWCCGTGILPTLLIDLENFEYHGVDINEEFLNFAKKRINKDNFKFYHEDALKFVPKLKYEINTMTSGYHHIQNQSKSQFLRNSNLSLRDDGILIVYERLIRPFSNEKEFNESNEEFYRRLIDHIRISDSRGMTNKRFEAFMNVCALSANAVGEYKIWYDYLMKDLAQNGFQVIRERKIWPKEDIFGDDKIGDIVITAKKV